MFSVKLTLRVETIKSSSSDGEKYWTQMTKGGERVDSVWPCVTCTRIFVCVMRGTVMPMVCSRYTQQSMVLD